MNALPGFSHKSCRKRFYALALTAFLMFPAVHTAAAEEIIQNELDWNGEDIVELSGDWNFFWNTLLTSMNDIPDGAKPYIIPFAGSWHTNTKGGNQLPWQGCGTYQKRIA